MVAPAVVVVAPAVVVVAAAVVVVLSSVPPQAATRPPSPAPTLIVAPATPAILRKSRLLTVFLVNSSNLSPDIASVPPSLACETLSAVPVCPRLN